MWVVQNGELTNDKFISSIPYSEKPFPLSLWRIDDNYKSLYHELLTSVIPIHDKETDDDGQIVVYDISTKQGGFRNNGLRILTPTSCKVTDELNGKYEAILEHPIDNDGVWQSIIELNIVKIGTQLFTIYKVVHSYEGSKGKLTAYMRHIFYQLNDRYIYKAHIEAKTVLEALNRIDAVTVKHEGTGLHEYTFGGFSNMPANYSVDLDACTPVEAIMGNKKTSLLSISGGELYRDNFYYSILQRKEDSRDNAFDLRVGLNLIGINREVDYSDFCTHLTGRDTFGNEFAVSYDPASALGRMAHHVTRSVTFRYDKPDSDRLAKDTVDYFSTIYMPYIKYTVRVKDLRNNPDFKGFNNNFRYNVGDTGKIYDERLKLITEQKIIKRVIDGIKDEIIELTFGNNQRSLTRPSKYANEVVTSNDRYMLNQIKQVEDMMLGEWKFTKRKKWGEVKLYTWKKLKGEA